MSTIKAPFEGRISAGTFPHCADGATARRKRLKNSGVIMQLMKSALAAVAFSLLAASSASAFTPASSGLNHKPALSSSETEVQYRPAPSRRYVRPAPRPRYVPGRRYSRAPHGWHRYSARPRNWQTRGCILVGPIWFCP